MNHSSIKWPHFPLLTRALLRAMAIVWVCIFVSACATSGNPPALTSAAQQTPQVQDTADGTGANLAPTVVSYPEYKDPLIKFNRAMFAFNDVSYRYVLIPLSKAYRWATPDPVETSIGNLFYNIKTPIYAINHLLQGKPKPMGINLLRFGINSTLGLLGLFDPAAAWFDLQRAPSSFDQSLERYGAGYGAYLVLPLLGPSHTRAVPGLFVDHFLNPVPYLVDDPESTAILAADGFQQFAHESSSYLILREKSDDPYVFFRNLSLQKVQRDAEYKQ